MNTLSVIIAEHDPSAARALMSFLDHHVGAVRLANSRTELESALPHEPVDLLIADLETVALDDVARITRDFHLPVICVHRIPDEDMWAAALEAGALDMCLRTDAGAILLAIRNHLADNRTSAA